MLSPVAYTIAGALANSFAYGILCVLFVISVFLFARRVPQSSTTTNYSVWLEPVTLASILLFVVVTAHWANTIYCLFGAFRAGSMEATILYIMDVSKPAEIAEETLTFLAGLLGDFVIIYRVWTISTHNRAVVIFPIVSAIGMSVAFFAVIYQMIRVGRLSNVAEQLELVSLLNRWVIPACVFTVSTNVYCSGFITWRLWSTHRRMGGGMSGDGIFRATAMVIESAALYTLCAILYFIAYEAKIEMFLFFSVLWPPTTGIAIMLINVRVGLNRIQEFNLNHTPPMSTLNHRHSNTMSTRSTEAGSVRTMHATGDDLPAMSLPYSYSLDPSKNPC